MEKQKYWLQIKDNIVVGYHDTEPNLTGTSGWMFITVNTDIPQVYMGASKDDIGDEAKLIENYDTVNLPTELETILEKLRELHSDILFWTAIEDTDKVDALQLEFEETKVQYQTLINT